MRAGPVQRNELDCVSQGLMRLDVSGWEGDPAQQPLQELSQDVPVFFTAGEFRRIIIAFLLLLLPLR